MTAVLIGEETAERDYVQYEIEKSFQRGNALLGIRIHNLKNRKGQTGNRGDNPLADYMVEADSGSHRLSDVFPTYDWVHDNGQQNITGWIEEAREANYEIPQAWRENLQRDEKMSLLDAAVAGAAFGVGIKITSEFLDELSRGFK